MVLELIPVVTGQEPGQSPSTSISSLTDVYGTKEKPKEENHLRHGDNISTLNGSESNPEEGCSSVTR